MISSLRYSQFFVLIYFFSISAFASGQADYHQVDSVMKVYNPLKIVNLTQYISSHFNTDKQRCRAAYIWMATHIHYDVNGYFAGGNIYASHWPSREPDSLKRENIYTEGVANKVFTEKKGICAGYSRLFVYILKQLNIPVWGVIGHGKIEIENSKTKYTANHEWNKVKIDGAYYLIDITWAAGTTNFSARKFTLQLNDHYYFTDPNLFIVDHFPENKQDALLNWVPSFGQFISMPMVYRNFWDLKPTNFYASAGIIKTTDSAFTLVFTSHQPISIIQIIGSSSHQQTKFYPQLGQTVYTGKNFTTLAPNNQYRIRFKPFSVADKKIIIYINGNAVMEFLQST